MRSAFPRSRGGSLLLTPGRTDHRTSPMESVREGSMYNVRPDQHTRTKDCGYHHRSTDTMVEASVMKP